MGTRRHSGHDSRERGAALLIMLIVLVVGALYVLVGRSQSTQLQIDHDRVTADALAQARQALIGDAVSPSAVPSGGYLSLPDLGFGVGGTVTEGVSAPNFTGNNKNYSVIGKVPWKTLGLPPLRDGQGECLWFVVSGRFKNSPPTDALNWDTLGQIDVLDGGGNVILGNVAALIVDPGAALDGQNRALADPAYAQCGGNYDARNYLDPYDAANAVAGQVNYFATGTNHRVAAGTGNEPFVMTRGNHYNDRFLTITVDDIFQPIIRRSDFAAQIAALLDDSDLRAQVETGHAQTVAVSGSATKGADNLNCGSIANSANRAFCKNWKEMLLLTQLPSAASIDIDGAPTPPCHRVLLFAGQRTATQVRNSATDKLDPANYLEGDNLAAFATPTAHTATFSGSSTFSWRSPGSDILRCLP